MKSKSLSFRLSLFVILASTVLLLGSIFIMAAISANGLKDAAIKDITKTLNTSMNKIEGRMSRVEGAINGVAWTVSENLDNPDYMFEITKNILKSNDNIFGCAIAFEPYYFKGKGEYFAPFSFRTEQGISAIQMGSSEYDYFTTEWYQLPRLTGGKGWSEPYFDEGGGNSLVSTYSIPVMDKNGNIYAVITADVTLGRILEQVEQVKLFENSHIFLSSNAGTFISHTDTSKCFVQTIFTSALESGSEGFQEAAKRIMRGENGNAEFKTSDGKDCFIVYNHLSNGWAMGGICYEKDVFAALRGLNNFMFMVMILGMIALFFGTKSIIGKLTKPLSDFSEAALEIAKGDFNAKLPEIKTEDELGQLHDSMDFMLKSINDYIDKLQTTTSAKQRIESELHIASAIQLSMVPHTFDVGEKLDIFAGLRPAKEVGGDLYDYTISGNILYFVVGDVSGKGVPAALYMAICCAGFRMISGLGLGTAEIVSRINNAFSLRNDSNMFVTMFLGKINLDTLEMEFCNAGHNPIILTTPDSKSRYLQAKPNLAAGLFEGFPYESETLQLEKGSRLLIYTDGVSEAENAAKELFGEDRLLSYVSSCPLEKSSKEFISGLISNMKEFTKDNPQNDDVTVFSIKI